MFLSANETSNDSALVSEPIANATINSRSITDRVAGPPTFDEYVASLGCIEIERVDDANNALAPTLVDDEVVYDSIGLISSVKTYLVFVNYNCEINDMFVDPVSFDENFGISLEFGTPYHLTGSLTTTGSYSVTITKTRLHVN